MSSFKQENLFASGPHHFVAGGLVERNELTSQPGADGATVTALGRGVRYIDQYGTLLADDAASLQAQLDQIEAAMDGQAGDLLDHLGRRYLNVLLIAWEPGDVRRVGLRLGLEYHARYVQPQPKVAG